MWIRRLDVTHFRNIEQAHLSLIPQLNFIVGHNGSGKSSLLEALHCLSTGQSFRTNKSLPIVSSGTYSTTIFGEVVSRDISHRIGIKKSLSEGTQLKIDSSSSNTQSELAVLTPIIGTTPEAEDLIEGNSKARLAYLDWCLFHVEHHFQQTWREYRRVLKQRNAALRSRMSKSMVSVWDNPLAQEGEKLHSLRVTLVSRLVPLIKELLARLLPAYTFSISYRKGWPKENSLVESLASSIETDMKMGFTHYGIHRADLLIKCDERPIAERLSRGQRKMTAIALRLAQAREYFNSTGQKPVLFIDDLPAELDASTRTNIINLIREIDLQAFVSSTSLEELSLKELSEYRVFHVEQGKVVNVV